MGESMSCGPSLMLQLARTGPYELSNHAPNLLSCLQPFLSSFGPAPLTPVFKFELGATCMYETAPASVGLPTTSQRCRVAVSALQPNNLYNFARPTCRCSKISSSSYPLNLSLICTVTAFHTKRSDLRRGSSFEHLRSRGSHHW